MLLAVAFHGVKPPSSSRARAGSHAGRALSRWLPEGAWPLARSSGTCLSSPSAVFLTGRSILAMDHVVPVRCAECRRVGTSPPGTARIRARLFGSDAVAMRPRLVRMRLALPTAGAVAGPHRRECISSRRRCQSNTDKCLGDNKGVFSFSFVPTASIPGRSRLTPSLLPFRLDPNQVSSRSSSERAGKSHASESCFLIRLSLDFAPMMPADHVLPGAVVKLSCGCIGQRVPMVESETKPQFFIKSACDNHRPGRIRAVDPDAPVALLEAD